MKKLALIAIAAVVAATGTVSTASAALSDRDGPVWHPESQAQVAGRNDNKGDRGGKDRGGRHDKKGKVIWRVRDKHHRPFFLFRVHDRGPDCFTRRMKVQDINGNVTTKSIHMCD